MRRRTVTPFELRTELLHCTLWKNSTRRLVAKAVVYARPLPILAVKSNQRPTDRSIGWSAFRMEGESFCEVEAWRGWRLSS